VRHHHTRSVMPGIVKLLIFSQRARAVPGAARRRPQALLPARGVKPHHAESLVRRVFDPHERSGDSLKERNNRIDRIHSYRRMPYSHFVKTPEGTLIYPILDTKREPPPARFRAIQYCQIDRSCKQMPVLISNMIIKFPGGKPSGVPTSENRRPSDSRATRAQTCDLSRCQVHCRHPSLE
jgi:hypothetical protein